MELLPAALNAVFVLVMTIVLTWYIRDRFAEQRQDTDRRFAEVRQDMAQVRSEVRQDMAQIRSELITIALAVGARTGPDAANA